MCVGGRGNGGVVVGCWSFTSWKHLRLYQDRVVMVMVGVVKWWYSDWLLELYVLETSTVISGTWNIGDDRSRGVLV